MLVGKGCMEHHIQVAGIIHRNICADYGLEVPGSRWDEMIENEQVKILWDFQIKLTKWCWLISLT